MSATFVRCVKCHRLLMVSPIITGDAPPRPFHVICKSCAKDK
jgi:hypothetical protein